MTLFRRFAKLFPQAFLRKISAKEKFKHLIQEKPLEAIKSGDFF